MRHALLAAVVQVSASLAAGPALAGPLRITTGTIEEDCASTPLEFEIRGVPESLEVVLKPGAGGEAVPCQVAERSDRGVRIVWVAPRLAKGTTATWQVDTVPAPSAPPASGPKPRVEVKASGTDFQVLIDGKEFTRLVADPAGRKPYLYPVIGPHGKMITRQFPMKAGVEGEEQDHPHQRSIWFTHGDVGGVNFWSEGNRAGSIRQTKAARTASGPVFGRIETSNEWIAPGEKKLLDDRRILTIYPLERGEVLLDISITLTPAGDSVVFGDTKEGSFGVRLDESMKEKRGGTIVNARGQRGMNQAWGKPAEWVDYTGMSGGAKVGVAILDHPESFRHPTHWHVRDYGLFAANPFGYRDFYRDKSKDGSFTLEKGKTMTFRYRVYFHNGGAEEASVAEVYRGFAKPPALHPSPLER
ncbi:MAG TPA: PmoA family protein [Planctomycetota bacterium]|nr:PmoA family protein [Planctomycetota bacterium]